MSVPPPLVNDMYLICWNFKMMEAWSNLHAQILFIIMILLSYPSEIIIRQNDLIILRRVCFYIVCQQHEMCEKERKPN